MKKGRKKGRKKEWIVGTVLFVGGWLMVVKSVFAYYGGSPRWFVALMFSGCAIGLIGTVVLNYADRK